MERAPDAHFAQLDARDLRRIQACAPYRSVFPQQYNDDRGAFLSHVQQLTENDIASDKNTNSVHHCGRTILYAIFRKD